MVNLRARRSTAAAAPPKRQSNHSSDTNSSRSSDDESVDGDSDGPPRLSPTLQFNSPTLAQIFGVAQSTASSSSPSLAMGRRRAAEVAASSSVPEASPLATSWPWERIKVEPLPVESASNSSVVEHKAQMESSSAAIPRAAEDVAPPNLAAEAAPSQQMREDDVGSVPPQLERERYDERPRVVKTPKRKPGRPSNRLSDAQLREIGQQRLSLRRTPRQLKNKEQFAEQQGNAVQMLLGQKPVVVAVSAGNGESGPHSLVSESPSDTTEEALLAANRRSAFPRHVIENASDHHLGLGYMVTNGLTRLVQRNDGSHLQMSRDLYKLFDDYDIA